MSTSDRAASVYTGAAAAAQHEVAHAADLATRRQFAVGGHRDAAGDVVVAAAVEVARMPAHISSTTARCGGRRTHGAAHLDQRRPQRVQRTDVEFGGGVKAARRDGAGRRQHPVAADQLAEVSLADQQVIAELVELVGVPPVAAGGRANPGRC